MLFQKVSHRADLNNFVIYKKKRRMKINLFNTAFNYSYFDIST